VSQINFVDVPQGPQQANAIQSGLVNVEQLVPVSDYSSLQGNGISLSIGNLPTKFQWVPLCKSSGPLTNVSVRQALYYATDREAINSAVFGGKGEVMHGLFPSSNQLYDSNLANTYPYNTQKAKQLLSQAGYSNGFTLTAMPFQGDPAAQKVAEILQAEWKEVGVNLKLVPTTDYVTDFLKNRKTDAGVPGGGQSGLSGAVAYTANGGLSNICGYSDPTMTSLVNQIYAAQSGSPEAKSSWDQAQQFINDNALAIYLGWAPIITAATKAVHDLKLIPYGSLLLDVWDVSVT
jgi:ABC-type transport system substrate-binding protein